MFCTNHPFRKIKYRLENHINQKIHIQHLKQIIGIIWTFLISYILGWKESLVTFEDRKETNASDGAKSGE